MVSASILSFNWINENLFVYPEYFPTPVYNFDENPLTDEKISLGRALFYDPILSRDNSISCASCHTSFNAFAHTDHDLSHGIYDRIGTRNAPALFNLAWQKSFMWDGAIHHLDMQALAPISSHAEMDEDIEHVVEKLRNSEIYPKLFLEAFNNNKITGTKLLKALSQFQLTLVSFDAPYDQMRRNEIRYTAQEKKGYQLFLNHCNKCHTEPLFTNLEFGNNGLSVDTTLHDFGRYQVTKLSIDSLMFKIPSLRNLKFSYPYMHDGRFSKLREVLNHYTSDDLGYLRIPSNNHVLKTNISLSATEKTDLIAFLLTLNDQTFVLNEAFRFPSELLLNKSKK